MLYFIVNETSRSGKGQIVWDQVETVLKERHTDYTVYKSEYAGHAGHIVAELCNTADAAVDLIIIGGDGTINEVINSIPDFGKIRLGVIPAGSGNDFAREFKISKDPTICINHLLDEREESNIDLGCVRWNQREGQRLFAISAGIGMDALVSKKALTSRLKNVLNKIKLGSLTYLILTVQTLFTMETACAQLHFPNGKQLSLNKMIFLAGMNFRAEGGGVPMAPHADHCDGKLDLCMAYGIPKWQTFFLLPLLVLAKHEHIRGFKIIRCRSCYLHSDQAMVVHADGEYCGTFADVEFTSLNQKLTIIR